MALSDKIPLNFAMMMNGYNWIILVLMVAIAGLALSLIFPTAINSTPGAPQ